jgi:hypothetical protein
MKSILFIISAVLMSQMALAGRIDPNRKVDINPYGSPCYQAQSKVAALQSKYVVQAIEWPGATALSRLKSGYQSMKSDSSIDSHRLQAAKQAIEAVQQGGSRTLTIEFVGVVDRRYRIHDFKIYDSNSCTEIAETIFDEYEI